MRSAAWMVAYAVVLVLLGAAYAAVVYVGTRTALFFAIAALAMAVVATVLVIKR